MLYNTGAEACILITNDRPEAESTNNEGTMQQAADNN
jgi:hypothetical protein